MAAFQPGHTKVGGRQKGTPNKTTAVVLKAIQAEGYEPIVEILTLLAEVTPREQLTVWLKLLPYCYPQLRAIELSMDPNKPLTVTPENMPAVYAAAVAAATRKDQARVAAKPA